MPLNESDQYRLLHKIDLPPSYMSLGLTPRAFKDGTDPSLTAFDAVISGPTDKLIFFKGEDVLTYDLRQGSITIDPTPLTEVFSTGALPGEFTLGIDSACWAGPSFPLVYFLFRGPNFIRLEAPSLEAEPSDWQLNMGPFETTQEFLRVPNPGGVGGGVGIPFGPSTHLHGLRDDEARLHFFSRDGRYARHNFNNGEVDISPKSTAQHFGLPDEFNGRVDLAFYGAGSAAEHIFFFSGFRYAEFDIKSRRVIHTGAIEERFPQLSLFIARPQLFLVEEYSLQSFVGPTALGRLVSSVTIGAQSVKESVIVTQVVSAAATRLHQNVVESQSEETSNDFIRKIESGKQSETASDSYQYRMNALFHGEAQAKGFWGGEVNADLAVEGGSDEQRKRTAQQAFSAIQAQARESTQSVSQKFVTTEEAKSITESVFTKETYRVENTTLSARTTEFFEILQKYLTLMVLSGVKGAYTDGMHRPELFPLGDFERRLRDVLVNKQSIPRVLEYIRKELGRIEDSSGEMRAIIQPQAGSLDVDGRVLSKFIFPETDPQQSVTVAGIIKAAQDFRLPTYQTRAIERSAGDPTSPGPKVVQPTKVERGPASPDA